MDEKTDGPAAHFSYERLTGTGISCEVRIRFFIPLRIHKLEKRVVRSTRLLSNKPRKPVAIEGYGLSVTKWLPLEIPASAGTLPYLTTKQDKLGHGLGGL